MDIRKQMEKEQQDYMNDLYAKDAKHIKKIKKVKKIKPNIVKQ